jgi:hypothetical protein
VFLSVVVEIGRSPDWRGRGKRVFAFFLLEEE